MICQEFPCQCCENMTALGKLCAECLRRSKVLENQVKSEKNADSNNHFNMGKAGMSREPILKVTGLTEVQVLAIGFGAQYSVLGDSYSLTPCDVYRESTLAALERKGYLGSKKTLGGHRWLTPKGIKVKEDFDKAHQEKYPEQYYSD